jgi:hypothetical protein
MSFGVKNMNKEREQVGKCETKRKKGERKRKKGERKRENKK